MEMPGVGAGADKESLELLSRLNVQAKGMRSKSKRIQDNQEKERERFAEEIEIELSVEEVVPPTPSKFKNIYLKYKLYPKICVDCVQLIIFFQKNKSIRGDLYRWRSNLLKLGRQQEQQKHLNKTNLACQHQGNQHV